VEPSDWAEKKKLALQRAKDLKYNRANQIDEELTLKPKINARPSYLGSMEKQKVNIVKTQLASNDLFERPLPATIARTKTLLAPSPGSDSLGKMMKSVGGGGGGGGGVDKAPTRRSIERADYAYEPAPIVPLGISSRGVERVNAEELFLRSLRAGHGGSELDSSKPAASAAEVRPRRPSQPSSSLTAAAAAAAASAASRERLATPTKPPVQRSSPTKSTTPSKLSPDAKPAAFASPRTQGVVRSRLSLLKQKIRRSEGALTQGLERSKTAGDGTPSPGRDLRGSSSSSLSQGHVPRSAPGLARTLAQQPPPQPQPQQQQQQQQPQQPQPASSLNDWFQSMAAGGAGGAGGGAGAAARRKPSPIQAAIDRRLQMVQRVLLEHWRNPNMNTLMGGLGLAALVLRELLAIDLFELRRKLRGLVGSNVDEFNTRLMHVGLLSIIVAAVAKID